MHHPMVMTAPWTIETNDRNPLRLDEPQPFKFDMDRLVFVVSLDQVARFADLPAILHQHAKIRVEHDVLERCRTNVLHARIRFKQRLSRDSAKRVSQRHRSSRHGVRTSLFPMDRMRSVLQGDLGQRRHWSKVYSR